MIRDKIWVSPSGKGEAVDEEKAKDDHNTS
jgi:hypothetical protein